MVVFGAASVFKFCNSSFFSATEVVVNRHRISGYHEGNYLNEAASALPSTSSSSWCWNTGNGGFIRIFSPLRRKLPSCGPIYGIRNRNARNRLQRKQAELVQEEGALKELIERDGSSPSNEEIPAFSVCHCQMCGRRSLFAGLIGGFASSEAQKAAAASDVQMNEYNKIIETLHPSRGLWYEQCFARVMESGMDSYEAGVADYKGELFEMLDDSVQHVLELGVGTGPNLKYYGNKPRVQKVIGIDPNLQMAEFCYSAALKAGLSESQFQFIHGVGEIIPLPDASVDAVVCTLVLCSVSDVTSTLKEVKRVLNPGGAFVFLEHVAALEGTGLRLGQKILDPLQQLLADGCHLTRDTLQDIQSAQFESVDAKRFTVPGLCVMGPHIAGVARTAHKDL